MSIPRKVIVITCVASCFVLIAFLIALGPYFYATRPRQPDPGAGRIFPQAEKNLDGFTETVYLSGAERYYADGIQVLIMLFALSGFLLNSRWKVISDPRRGIPKKLY